jgi:probable rRNA maturation factor
LTILIRRLARLPLSCRKAGLFRSACRKALGRKASRPGELNVVFTTNREIRRINKRYLRHDRNTDVIAFPYRRSLPEKSVPRRSPFGDVFVSVDQARIQARELGHSFLKELLTLSIHGTLHLMGYDDHTPAERRRMFAKQDRIVGKLVPPP